MQNLCQFLEQAIISQLSISYLFSLFFKFTLLPEANYSEQRERNLTFLEK